MAVDVRCGRPAGTPFTHDGALFRPAMDNSSSYGGRVVITHVLELTPDAFAERTVAVVPPFPGRFGDGLHTIAGAGPVTVVDGKRRAVVPTALPAKMLSYRRSKVVVPRPGSAPGPADALAAEEAAGREEPAVDGDDRSHVDRAR